MGQLIFIDLRDRYGITQVVVDAAEAPEAHAVASNVRSEFVLQVDGQVTERLAGTQNPKLATGDVEVRAERHRRSSGRRARRPSSSTTPTPRSTRRVRLTYRYLDLRREPLQQRILARGRLVQAIREVAPRGGLRRGRDAAAHQVHARGCARLHRAVAAPAGQRLRAAAEPAAAQAAADGERHGPLLPDRALPPRRGPARRPPARVHAARPRDELRGEDDVMAWVEEMALAVTRAVVPERPILAEPFPRLTWREAIDRFGSDKPDLRYGLELRDLGVAATGSGFRVFDDALDAGGRVVGLAGPGMAGLSRARIDELTEVARRGWREGPRLARARRGRGASAGRSSRSSARIAHDRSSRRPAAVRATSSSSWPTPTSHAQEALGTVRVRARGGRWASLDPAALSYVWIHRFPMYAWDEENRRWDATHNPFSAVVPEDEPLLTTASGDLARPDRSDPAGRALRAPVRPRAQRLGARRRVGALPLARAALAVVRAHGPLARAAAGSASAASWRRSSTARRPTAGSRSGSTAGRRC